MLNSPSEDRKSAGFELRPMCFKGLLDADATTDVLQKILVLGLVSLLVLMVNLAIAGYHYHSWSNHPNEVQCQPLGYIDQYAPPDPPRPARK